MEGKLSPLWWSLCSWDVWLPSFSFSLCELLSCRSMLLITFLLIWSQKYVSHILLSNPFFICQYFRSCASYLYLYFANYINVQTPSLEHFSVLHFPYSDLKLACASPPHCLWYHDQKFQTSIIINESQYHRVRFSIYPTVPYVRLPCWFVFTEGPSTNATIKGICTVCVCPRGWTSSHLLLFSHFLYVFAFLFQFICL